MSLSAKELLPKQIYDQFGDAGVRYLNPKLAPIVLYIVSLFPGAKVYVNTWSFKNPSGRALNLQGNTFNGRTIRLAGMDDYKPFSDHSWGNAIDFDIIISDDAHKDSLLVQEKILEKEVATELVCMGLTAIEKDTEGWTHISVSDLELFDFDEKNGITLIPIPK